MLLVVTGADESGSLCRHSECAFKWLLTHRRSITPELWRILRWAASAYAHYLWKHAASWLPFTKAGTQGQREWEWEMCMLTPSDETLLQLCIWVHFCPCALVSVWQPACACVCTCVCACSVAYSVCCLLRFQTLIASSRQQYLSLFSPLAVCRVL